MVFESKNIRVRLNKSIVVPDYVNMLFLCQHVRDHFDGDAKQTCGQASISQPQIASVSTPLPPIQEQYRIIAKVNDLMALCDQLEKEIEDRSNNAISLSNATIQQIIEMT